MNISDIDLNLLRAFDAVLREGSVTAAARRVGLSQPAMSNALARLRRLFGDPLFVRSPGGMHPTPFAARLGESVRQAMDLIQGSLAQQAGFDPPTSDRTFRLHMSDVGEMVFLPRLLERLGNLAPAIRIEAGQRSQVDLADALASGAIDIAIGFLPPQGGGIAQRRLFFDHYVCMLRRSHPRIGKKITLAQFLAASHALVLADGTGHQVVEQALIQRGLKQNIVLRVPHFMALPMVVERTDLLAIVPAGFARALARSGRLRTLDLPIELPRLEVKLCWHERFERDPGNRWLREQLIALYAQ